MRIISIDSARAGLVIPFAEILPLTGVDPRDICDAIAERYSFADEPDFSEGLQSTRENGLVFEVGKLKSGSHGAIDKLVITGEMVVGWATPTDVAKEFMQDLLNWGASSQGWRVTPTLFESLVFLSQITVEFDAPMGKLIRKLEALSGMFQNVFNRSYNSNQQIDFAGLFFNYDRTYLTAPLNQLSSFGIDRKLGAAFDTNRFFCTAPVQTQDHIKLLEEIELMAAAD
ncbi:MAG: hypothetical protein AABO57_19680 [Acidobacteriota bacterium]